MARSRRSRRQEAAAVEEPDEDFVDEDFAEEEDEIEVEEPAPSSRSSRRSRRSAAAADDDASTSGRRSSRRSARSDAGKSGRKSKRSKKSRSAKSQKEGSGKGGTIILVILLIAGLGGGGYFGYMHFIYEEPQTVVAKVDGADVEFKGTKSELARQFWRAANDLDKSVEKAISFKNADLAEERLDELSEILVQPVLGAGNPNPNPEDPAIGDFSLVPQAVEKIKSLDTYRAQIKRIRDDNAVDRNLKRSMALFDQLRDAENDEAIDNIEIEVLRFTENPVEPDAGPDPIMKKRYEAQVMQVQSQLRKIEDERALRLRAVTVDVVREMNQSTQLLIQQDKYGEALRITDEKIREYPKADLGPIRQKVLDAAAEGWKTAKTVAEGNFRRATDAGSAAENRETALREAIKELEHVIDTFGSDVPEMQQYTREAESLLREYKKRL